MGNTDFLKYQVIVFTVMILFNILFQIDVGLTKQYEKVSQPNITNLGNLLSYIWVLAVFLFRIIFFQTSIIFINFILNSFRIILIIEVIAYLRDLTKA